MNNDPQNFWAQLSGTQSLNQANQSFANAQNQVNNTIGQAAQATPGANIAMQTQSANMNNYQGIDYPAMGQSGASPSPNQNAAFAPPSAQSQPDSSSRGFNPWSLQGEANSR